MALQIFNVTNFGAYGDGVHNDTNAIQAALDAAHAAGGGTVVMPAGTFLVTGHGDASEGCLKIYSNTTLSGDGMGETEIKLKDGSNEKITGILRTPSGEVTHDVTIENLTINGNRDNTGNEVDGLFTGVEPGSPQADYNITISGVEIKEVSRYGFDPHEQTTNMLIENCVAHDNTGDGFTLDYISDSVIRNCASYDNGRNGFNLVTSSHDVTFIDNVAYGNGAAGLAVQKGSEDRPFIDNVLIQGGSFHDNGQQGVLVKLSYGVTLTGAEIYGNGQEGVLIQGASRNEILGNQIHDNGLASPGSYNGVSIEAYDDRAGVQGTFKYWRAEDNLVQGNAIAGDAGQPLRFGVEEVDDGSGRNQVLGNTITGAYRIDVVLSNATSTTDGPPRLYGTGASDVLAGTATDNAILADNGNDQITGGGGNDLIDGGNGTDRAIYLADLLDYILVRNADGSWLVSDRSLAEGTDRLTRIEALAFAGIVFSTADLELRLAGKIGDRYELTGTAGANTLAGATGDDVLNGGGGNDLLIGYDGNDSYVVDASGDDVVEAAGGGYDIVKASATYTLAQNVEELTLTGNAAINGTGNGLGNLINGNAAANVLAGIDGDDWLYSKSGNDLLKGGDGDDWLYGSDGTDTLEGGNGNDMLNGGAGADVLKGGTGDDIYYVDHAGDAVTDTSNSSNGGHDEVRSSVDFTLGASLEDLRLSGSGNIDGIGNSIDNRLIGNGGRNLLSGGYGNDRLEGNGGNDTLDGGRGADRMLGGAGADTFQLRKYDIAGDSILDFSGAEGDILTIAGFTAKAQLVRDSSDTWSVVDGSYRESFQIAGVTALNPDQYAFVA